LQRLHGVLRRIGKGGKCCSWLYNAKILLRTMRHISFVTVARGEPPALLTISFKFFWIVDAPCTVDQRMIKVLLPLVYLVAFQIMRIHSHKCILGKEQRSAIFKS